VATSTDVAQRRDTLVQRLFEATIGAMDVFAVYLGDRLGLYRALAERGALTPRELAEATGTDERYAREWLEQQAASGILEVDGFPGFEVLPIENDFYRFYRLTSAA
jgi:hypothetical protein